MAFMRELLFTGATGAAVSFFAFFFDDFFTWSIGVGASALTSSSSVVGVCAKACGISTQQRVRSPASARSNGDKRRLWLRIRPGERQRVDRAGKCKGICDFRKGFERKESFQIRKAFNSPYAAAKSPQRVG